VVGVIVNLALFFGYHVLWPHRHPNPGPGRPRAAGKTSLAEALLQRAGAIGAPAAWSAAAPSATTTRWSGAWHSLNRR
jgi:hypothetical protein